MIESIFNKLFLIYLQYMVVVNDDYYLHHFFEQHFLDYQSKKKEIFSTVIEKFVLHNQIELNVVEYDHYLKLFLIDQ